MKYKFLITGKMGVGKSTLMSCLKEKTNISPCGFISMPYYNDLQERLGFYLHSLHQINCKNDVPFSIGKKGIKETFDTLGVECLSRAIKNDNSFVFIDELGRFEENSIIFIDKLFELFYTNKFICAIIKKEEINYLNNLKSIKDITLIDLDNENFEESLCLLINSINQFMKEVK